MTPGVRARRGARTWGLAALVLALPHINCAAVAKLLKLSRPGFPNADRTFLLKQLPCELNEMLWVKALLTAPVTQKVPSEC